PGEGDFRYVERLQAWKYFEHKKRRRIYGLNDDGTLRHINHYDENLDKRRRDRVAADGHVYLRTTFVPGTGTGDGEDADVEKLEYLTPSGRPYVVCRPNGNELTFTVLDQHGEVTAEFPDQHHFRSSWVADFA